MPKILTKTSFASLRSEKTKWQDQLNELASELEFSRKENNDRKAEKQNLSQMNDELAGKVKFLKQENKKGRKMVCILRKRSSFIQCSSVTTGGNLN